MEKSSRTKIMTAMKKQKKAITIRKGSCNNNTLEKVYLTYNLI